MKRRNLRGALPLLVAVLLCSCGSDRELDPSIEKLGRATGPVAPDEPPAASPSPGGEPDRKEPGASHEGVVQERIHVPNYTYLRVGLADGGEIWAAVPRTEIEVGARVRVVESLVMRDFTSPTLRRTFASIVFGTLEGAPGPTADAGPKNDVGAIHESPLLPPGHPPI